MKAINKIIYLLLLSMFLISSLNAADQDVELRKGWNQIVVPFDHIKIDLLTASEDIEVIWAYQNRRYNLATRIKEYKNLAKESDTVGIIRSLSYGEAIYVLANKDTVITFVGQKNVRPPVRADKITSQWTQMSKNDFGAQEWSVISKIVEGTTVIAAKIVMHEGRPSIKVYSNDATEKARIEKSGYFEDFEVADYESFWIKDITNDADIDKFDFSILNNPSKGGEIVKFSVEASSTNKNRHYLSVRIVAFKDGNLNNEEHILFDDYVKLNENSQQIKAVLPMLKAGDFGSYRIFAIKDLAAQYDKVGIDLYNIRYENVENVKEEYSKILDNSDYQNLSINSNNTDAVYDLLIESREYSNSIFLYDPIKELNRLAKNQFKDFNEYKYEDIAKHTEFQLSLKAYGNNAQTINKTKVKAYLKVAGNYEEIINLNEDASLGTSYEIDNLDITLPGESHKADFTLSLMMYGVKALTDITNTELYDTILAEFKERKNSDATSNDYNDSSNYKYRVCLDTECTKWIYKKDFELGIAVKDVSNNQAQEPDNGNDLIAITTITLYSEVFSQEEIEDYESKDTTIAISDLLLREDIYNENIFNKNSIKSRISLLGVYASQTNELINDLISLQTNKELVDPLLTFKNSKIELMIDVDSGLKDRWIEYKDKVGDDTKLCNRENYFEKVIPYTKKVHESGAEDILVLTAVSDLCIYNVKFSYINTLTKATIDEIAVLFKRFANLKNSKSEEERLEDVFNPLFSFDNGTLSMPEFLGVTLPVIKKKIGGGATFSAKLAIDSELNELRANTYADIDVALIVEFKLFDLDFETVLSGGIPENSRFDFDMYAIDPYADNDLELKEVYAIHFPIPTSYAMEQKVDLTFEYAQSIHFSIGPIPCFFRFAIGSYSYFLAGIDVTYGDHLIIYAVPGERIYGTVAGGVGVDLKVLNFELGIKAEDFTVVRASVPVVAKLNEFQLNKEGFSTVFSTFSNLELKVAEIAINLYALVELDLKIVSINLVDEEVELWSYDGIDPWGGAASGTHSNSCQGEYSGKELFCIQKRLAIQFPFSGLTHSECSLLDAEYTRKATYNNDTSFLYDTAEYRKVRGCKVDSYEFNYEFEWHLTDDQYDELNNVDFWKDDSRVLTNQREEYGQEDDSSNSEPWRDTWDRVQE